MARPWRGGGQFAVSAVAFTVPPGRLRGRAAFISPFTSHHHVSFQSVSAFWVQRVQVLPRGQWFCTVVRILGSFGCGRVGRVRSGRGQFHQGPVSIGAGIQGSGRAAVAVGAAFQGIGSACGQRRRLVGSGASGGAALSSRGQPRGGIRRWRFRHLGQHSSRGQYGLCSIGKHLGATGLVGQSRPASRYVALVCTGSAAAHTALVRAGPPSLGWPPALRCRRHTEQVTRSQPNEKGKKKATNLTAVTPNRLSHEMRKSAHKEFT